MLALSGHGQGPQPLARGILGRGKGLVTCRTGAGAWGSRTSRFRQQRGERRKMPQTPLERRSGTECQSQWLWEGSVAPTHVTSQWALCRGHWHDLESAPYAHKRHQHPKTLLLLLLCGDFVLEAFTQSVPGQFRSIRAVSGSVVVLGCHRLGSEVPESPPNTALHPYL